MRKAHVIVLALIVVVAAALWSIRRPEDYSETRAPAPTSRADHQQLPQNREVTSTPVPVTFTPPEATPTPLEKPDEKLIAAKKHLPWASDENLKMLIKGGVNIENIERGRSKISNDLVQFKVAVSQYRKLTGENLNGNNVAIAKALLGENPKKQVFIDWPKKQLSQVGELLDPWGTAYEMRVTEDVLEIRSAGPDLLFGTADDEMLKP